MRHVILILLLLGALARLSAQVTDEDRKREAALRDKADNARSDTTVPFGWSHGIVAGVNLSQVSFTHWAAGGENSLAYAAYLNGRSQHRSEMFDWLNTYKLIFGQARLSSQGLRKTDDELYFESLLFYRMDPHFNPYAAFTFRTQFAPGYLYPDNAPEVQISKFFDPAYFTQSIGMAWRPVREVTSRLGVAMREIITSDYPAFADDPETAEIEKTRTFGGLEWVTDVKWGFAENMEFLSRLEVFSPFSTPDIMTVRWDNTITAKVNTYITAMVSAQLLYDEIVIPRTQVKQGISIGLSYTLL
jgi:hypothetical protein